VEVEPARCFRLGAVTRPALLARLIVLPERGGQVLFCIFEDEHRLRGYVQLHGSH
jgi:hypothetical protein